MRSLWNKITGQTKPDSPPNQNQNVDFQPDLNQDQNAIFQPQFSPQLAQQNQNLAQMQAPIFQQQMYQNNIPDLYDNFSDDYDTNYTNVNDSQTERLTEDLVEAQSQVKDPKNVAKKSDKYNSLDLSDLMTMSLEMAKDKIKLSSSDQHQSVKISISETKLDEIEKQLAEDETSNDASLDVFCVIDRSGSMYGKRLKYVKQSLKYLLDLLKPEDRISIVLFDNRSDVLLAPKLVGKSRDLIEKSIDSIQDRGSTDIRAGLKEAFQQMLKRKSKNQVTGVLLLSDGQDNQYFNKGGSKVDAFFEEWSAKLKDHEHTVHTFGYGDDHDETLLDQIAKCKGGNFYYVKDLDLVSDNFIDCLGGLSSVIGQNAQIRVNLKSADLFPEIRFKKTFGAMWSGDKETERFIAINNISKGTKKDFMFEMTIPGVKNTDILENGSKICRIIEATFTAENLEEKKFEKTENLDLPVYNESENVVINENFEVKKNAARVKVAEMINFAQERCDSANYSAGERCLSDMEHELSDLGEEDNDPMFFMMKEKLNEQKKAVGKKKKGLDCGYNMKAMSKNMCNAFEYQESAPAFLGNCYENATKTKMQSKLKKTKANY